MVGPTFTCTACESVLPADSFYVLTSGPRAGKRFSRCKACENAGSRARHAANRERRNASSRAYQAEHADAIREQRAAYRDANREKVRGQMRAWQEANRELTRERARAWGKANPQKVRDLGARRYARKMGAPVVEKIDREAIIARDRSICHLCRRKVARSVLTLDHIIPLSEGGEHTARNLAVAHARCNYSKGARPANDQLRLVG